MGLCTHCYTNSLAGLWYNFIACLKCRMTTELAKNYFTPEALPQRWDILIVENDGGERRLVITEINKDGVDEYSRFVVEQINVLYKRLDKIRNPVGSFRRSGVRYKQRILRELNEQREKDRQQIPLLLSALSGKGQPVRFIRAQGEIISCVVEMDGSSASKL